MSASADAEPAAVWTRAPGKQYSRASGGAGVYLVREDGTKVLDGSSGAAVSCLGHGHADVTAAIVQQAQQLAFAHSSFFASEPAQKLARMLTKSSGGAFEKLLILNSGSEAVESAIKISRQYALCNDEPERVNIIARESAYHGNTIGALSAGHHPGRRGPFVPMLSPVFHHVSPCFFRRDARPGEDESAYVKRLLADYEEMFIKLGPSTVAAVIVEPVSGATLGAVPAAQGYLAGLRELCDKHGALLIFDEVMCGMGRIGSQHAWQSLGGVAPDVQTIGKGLAGGYQPISGVLFSKKISDAITKSHSTKPFMSGHTYQDHPIGCAAAVATQQAIIQDNLLENVRATGELLKNKLKAEVPLLKEIRGMGLFVAVEFATETHDKPIGAEVAAACLKNGAAVYLCSDLVDAILFAPPYIISADEIDELVGIFVKSTREVLNSRSIGVNGHG
ncbi:uncharacterized protein HMPREF1541_03234 [Cyphellophora europaea CBS 101466]|uniref:Adenosylmethionine-8-amino-7-oxononanoate transaminase n=1 Tax=Cyphellophora europaea (strain CBS 101466) TaxID=1220924 RepID=W2S022_CYPE1|nr:uncharacterized protein HMPREF1541_03234 [Cyphellophora europaea CBS 101466]ETN41299.1 hypothetical protein HMPREF1541_03234 [Cyphellophora europaea CBS 101466]